MKIQPIIGDRVCLNSNIFRTRSTLGHGSTPAHRDAKQKTQRAKAPRLPSASARPRFEVRHARKCGRDVGWAKSGFRPPPRRIATAAPSAQFDALLSGSQPFSDGIVSILESAFPLFPVWICSPQTVFVMLRCAF